MMTPDDAASVLRCWLCQGPLWAIAAKPWRFRCPSCAIVMRPDDVGKLQQAVMRMVLAAPDLEKVTGDGGGA